MKLTAKIHGIIDYVVVVFLWASPSLFGLPAFTTTFTYALGCIHLALTTCTRFEFGIFKFIPLRIHGIIEVVVSFALVGVAFYLGKLEGAMARNFYLLFALAVFITWLGTDYKTRCDAPG